MMCLPEWEIQNPQQMPPSGKARAMVISSHISDIPIFFPWNFIFVLILLTILSLGPMSWNFLTHPTSARSWGSCSNHSPFLYCAGNFPLPGGPSPSPDRSLMSLFLKTLHLCQLLCTASEKGLSSLPHNPEDSGISQPGQKSSYASGF